MGHPPGVATVGTTAMAHPPSRAAQSVAMAAKCSAAHTWLLEKNDGASVIYATISVVRRLTLDAVAVEGRHASSSVRREVAATSEPQKFQSILTCGLGAKLRLKAFLAVSRITR